MLIFWHLTVAPTNAIFCFCELHDPNVQVLKIIKDGKGSANTNNVLHKNKNEIILESRVKCGKQNLLPINMATLHVYWNYLQAFVQRIIWHTLLANFVDKIFEFKWQEGYQKL